MGVSIIIPAYNSEKYLAAAIQSVLAQTRDDWEAIIVNDGSTDQTGTIAETFAAKDTRIRVVHQANAGLSGARNRGFAETRADYEYVMYLDSDDILEPDALGVLLQALEKDPDAVGAHGMLRYINNLGEPITINGTQTSPLRRHGIQGKWLKLWPVSAPTTFEVLAYGNAILLGLIVRRAKQEAAGGFDPNLKCEDWDMWLRLSRLGHIAFVNRIVFRYRRHEANLTRHRALIIDGDLCVRKKMYASAELTAQEKKLILIGYRYGELKKAYQRLIYTGRNLRKGKWIDAFKQLQLAMGDILSSIKGLTRA